MQYELDGTFSMLPIKLYPTFTTKSDMHKVELNLKIFNKLPQNLRCKALTITFRVPDGIQRVYFKQQNVHSKLQI